MEPGTSTPESPDRRLWWRLVLLVVLILGFLLVLGWFLGDAALGFAYEGFD